MYIHYDERGPHILTTNSAYCEITFANRSTIYGIGCMGNLVFGRVQREPYSGGDPPRDVVSRNSPKIDENVDFWRNFIKYGEIHVGSIILI